MAHVQIVRYIDDVTGEEADTVETVTFGHQGVAYEVDMSPETVKRYEEALAPFLAAARRVGRVGVTASGYVLRSVPGQRHKPTIDREQSRAIRLWWQRAAEIDPSLPALSPRGRVPQGVLLAYERHGGRLPEPAPIVAQAAAEPVAASAAAVRQSGSVGGEMRMVPPEARKATKRTRKTAP